jgi:hypothetical protein
MFDIAISIRDNIEWLKSYLLSYKKNTSNPYNYTIHIIDTSTAENKKEVEDILCLFSDLNIRFYHGNRDIHYHKTWTEVIDKSEKEFVIFTHVDTVYLMKDWDIFLIDQLTNGKTLISVSVRSKIYPESVWICCYRDLLIESGFDHETISGVLVEHGKIKTLHNMTKNNSIYINNVISVPKYGDIALLNNKEFIYHNYYSGRIKTDNQCPVPSGSSELAYLNQREDFTKTVLLLESYLLRNDTSNLYSYLINQ